MKKPSKAATEIVEIRLGTLEDMTASNNYEINALKNRFWDLNQKLDKAARFITRNKGRLRSIEDTVDGYHLTLANKKRLAQTISRVFNSVELYTLCLDMDVDPELLTSDHIMKAIELIDYLHRRSFIPHLISRLKTLRPLEEWYEKDIISKENT